VSLRKRSKRNISDIPKEKGKVNSHLPFEIQAILVLIQVQKGIPKEKKQKECYNIPKVNKKENPPSQTYQTEIRIQEGVP
jgi:hypothetical protein